MHLPIKKIFGKSLTFAVKTPTISEPSWCNEVPRWRQLDDVTFAVVEAAAQFRLQHKNEWDTYRPHSLWLADQGGSNAADAFFVEGGSRSPSRFVGTLPSIRSSSLTLLMDWHGPVLCLQNGSRSTASGLAEAYWSHSAGDDQPSWLVYTRKKNHEKFTEFYVTFVICGLSHGDFTLAVGTQSDAEENIFADADINAKFCADLASNAISQTYYLGSEVVLHGGAT